MATPTVGRFFAIENSKNRGSYLTVERHGVIDNGYSVYMSSNPSAPEACWQVLPGGRIGSACDTGYVLSYYGNSTRVSVEMDSTLKNPTQQLTFRTGSGGTYMIQLQGKRMFMGCTTQGSDADWKSATSTTTYWNFVPVNEINDRDRDIPRNPTGPGTQNPNTGGVPFQLFPTRIVSCQDGTSDVYVGENPNPGDSYNGTPLHVRAFVWQFYNTAKDVSNRAFDLPPVFVLGQWAYESGWGKDARCVRNQNWGNTQKFTDLLGHIGIDPLSPYPAMYDGLNCYGNAYATYMGNWPGQKPLQSYLDECRKNRISPSEKKCSYLVANSDFCPGSEDYYETIVNQCINLVNKALIS